MQVVVQATKSLDKIIMVLLLLVGAVVLAGLAVYQIQAAAEDLVMVPVVQA
jgi:CRISPR/Cas system-associated protein Csm6